MEPTVTAEEEPGPRGPGLGHRLAWSAFRWLAILVFFVLLIGSAWLWLALRFSYADGLRTGQVKDFSRRGWFIKTWEGELVTADQADGTPGLFPFSVRRRDVAERIQALEGKKVVLSYQYHRGLLPKVFGETSYFIVDVHPSEMEENGLPASPLSMGDPPALPY